MTFTFKTKQPDKPQLPPATKFKLNIKAKPAEPVKKLGRAGDILHGSGITKAKLVSAEKAKTKQLDKTFKFKAKTDIAKLPETEIVDHEPKLVSFGTREISESQLDESQKLALTGSVQEQYACIIGEAGTGKTTVTKALVRRLMETLGMMSTEEALPISQRGKGKASSVPAIAFVSFTGRAVEQMKKALPKEYYSQCSTIHSLLGYAPTMELREDDEGMPKEVKVFRPTFDETNKLPHEIIVIDEAGMCRVDLFNEVMAAKRSGCRIYLLGDLSQLPPVQGRSVLGYAISAWPTFQLLHVHRTALDNPVIMNAHRILKGKHPIQDDKHFLMMELDAGSLKASSQIEAAVQKLHKAGMFNPIKDALLVPQNSSMLGQENLNSKLKMYFNPPTTDASGLPVNPRIKIKSGNGYALLAVGDKIMNTQNDRLKGLTNGMTGLIVDIQLNDKFKSLAAYTDTMNLSLEDFSDLSEEINTLHANQTTDTSSEKEVGELQASHVTTVDWENGTTTTLNSRGQYNNLMHAYAFTGHKAQGGEYDTVVIAIHSANASMLCREWLYTAITRAKQRVILLSNYRGLSQSVKNQRVKGKTMEEKARCFQDWAARSLANDKTDQLPTLPPSRKQEAAE